MHARHLCLVALLLLLPACGGGAGGQPVPLTVAVAATDALTGDAIDGLPPVSGVTPIVGDDPSDRALRAFYSFDLTAVPAGAVVVEAVLTTAQVFAAFGTPYADLGGAVVVDHVDLHGALDTTDFDSAALTPSPGAISTSAAPGVRALNVTAQVAADLGAGRATSEYRLRFPVDTEGGGDEDTVQFEGADGANGTVPTLTITYTVP